MNSQKIKNFFSIPKNPFVLITFIVLVILGLSLIKLFNSGHLSADSYRNILKIRDLKQIELAEELYHDKFGFYTENFEDLKEEGLISRIPKDKILNKSYDFCVSENKQYYLMGAELKNPNFEYYKNSKINKNSQSKVCKLNNNKFCGENGYYCVSNWDGTSEINKQTKNSDLNIQNNSCGPESPIACSSNTRLTCVNKEWKCEKY